ncbi:MAG: hypothetical protein H0X66_15220 [Verrucomicrobia bacterium]|nr:hypothetical protein [Verrucomicrobiota bacterium]
MLCFPEAPSDFGYEISKISTVLGLKITNKPNRFHLALAWQDTTVRTFSTDSLPPNTHLLNSRCPDIGKDYIEEVFESVFGYSLRVDPTTHKGPCVRKSIENAKHDGVVLNCPIQKTEAGYVYQRLINNQSDDDYIVDLRTPFYRDALPLVYLKYRPTKTRFADRNDRVELARTDDIYSPAEKELILKFCRALQLEYGGLDVLRDKESGLLYIVDVNNTPFGPPIQLSTSDQIRAVATLAATFYEKFINQVPLPPAPKAETAQTSV